MDAKHRPEVLIVLGDPASQNRQILRNAMTDQGFRTVRDYSKLSMVREEVTKSLPDLLICDTHMSDGDVCDFVMELRHNQVGNNPFVPVILYTWDARPELVRRVANSGADDLLAAPISPAKLFARIDALVARRKPFVVTSDYIGPDRRKDRAREGSDEIPLIEVPNTLRAKVLGEPIADADLQATIDEVMREINEQRLVRLSYQIGFLVGIIVPAYQGGCVGPEIEAHVRRLADVSTELGRRVTGSRFEHVADLCRSLIRVAGAVRRNAKNPNPKDIELLKPLADSILVGFNPEKNAAAMAGEITRMVKRFAARAAANAMNQSQGR